MSPVRPRRHGPGALSQGHIVDTLRFVLIISFAMVTMKLWSDWQQAYGPQTGIQQADSQQGVETPPLTAGEIPEIITDAEPVETPALQIESVISSTDSVEIETDIFRINIDIQGAGIRQAALLDFPLDIDRPNDPFVLMENTQDTTFISQGGLLSKQPAPTNDSLYQSQKENYKMQAGEDLLRVPFTWSLDGITVTKTYEFARGSHLILVSYRIQNGTDSDWSGRSYHQIKRNNPEQSRMRFIYTYTGTVISSPENRYEKITFDDITEDPIAREAQNGWIAVIQHYFLTALIPTDKDSYHHFYTRALGNELYTSGLITPGIGVASGETKEITELIYVGPKTQDILAEISEGLDLTVDYGTLWFLAKPLFWGLGKIHDITNNWGWSIILVTILLKLFFYKLSAAGYRSMANMRRVQPRLVSLKERYKDDRVSMNQAMMQIYKEEKINPFGGCFPILVQIPVFIALYWVLLESVELRQAGFVLWLKDLSTPDPYWVLPLIMGVTMFIQQKLNPAPIDPVQAKVMMMLPIVFTIFFGFFPSGLVLYWVANNTLSILQQWFIMKNLEKAGLGAKQK
jgi:YidC/Oxa1 family membrane protein insertase